MKDATPERGSCAALRLPYRRWGQHSRQPYWGVMPSAVGSVTGLAVEMKAGPDPRSQSCQGSLRNLAARCDPAGTRLRTDLEAVGSSRDGLEKQPTALKSQRLPVDSDLLRLRGDGL
jgi:hypothetical protein